MDQLCGELAVGEDAEECLMWDRVEGLIEVNV